MLLKVLVVALVAVSAASADLDGITGNMRKTVEWLNGHSKLDKNSTIILAVASGSLLKQEKGGIQTQVQAAYLDLIVGLSKEKLSDSDPEAKLYFTAQQFKAAGDFGPDKTVKNNPVGASPTIYEIYLNSQSTELYKKCFDAFYKDNPEVLEHKGKCVISDECMEAVLDPSKGIGPDLRHRFILFAEKLHNCNNFSPNYKALVSGHMQELNDQINTLLKYIANNGGKLDPGLRYTFLRKIILLAISGYNVITPVIEAYVESLAQSEGYCGVSEDEDIDKVVLSAQCYAIWAFKRQMLLNE